MTLFNRLTKLWLHCWYKSLSLPLMLVVTLLMGYMVNAQGSIPGLVPVKCPAGGSGVDGDAFADTPTPGIGDLFDNLFGGVNTGGSVISGFVAGAPVFTCIPPASPANSTFFLQDAYINDPTIFTAANKINDNPNTYTWGPGSSPNKNEIQNCGAHFSYGDPALGGTATDLWCLFAGDRQVTSGSSYIDFEFLQASLTMTGTTSGGFVTTGPDGGRTEGDILVTIEFTKGGGDATAVIRVWEPKPGGGFEYVVHPNSDFPGEIFITNNTSNTSVPFNVYGTTPGTYVPNQWAEGAINLTQVFLDTGPNDPCFSLSTLFIRTRSSGSSAQSELKDFPGAPIQLNLDLVPSAPTTTGDANCGPGIVDLSASGCTGGTLKWYNAATNGTLVTTGSTYSPNLTQTTSFWVSCTNAAGCEGPRAQVTGTINPIPAAPTTTGDSRCGPGSVALSASGCSGGTLKWYDAAILGTQVATGATYSPNITQTTSFLVSCTSAAGCEGARTQVTGIVRDIPDAPTASVIQPTCTVAIGSITVTAPLGVGITYSINGVDYQSDTTFPNLVPATYNVTARANGCTSTATSKTIDPQPGTPDAPLLKIIEPSLCGPATGSIEVCNPIVGYIYKLNGANPGITATVGQPVIFDNLAAGSNPSVTVTTGAGCVSSPANCSSATTTCSAPTAKIMDEVSKEKVINNETSKVGFEAYPVPFKDQLTIKYNFDYASDVRIEVFNLQGILMLAKNDAKAYQNKEVILDLKTNNKQEQVYIVKLTTNRGSSTKTVMSSY